MVPITAFYTGILALILVGLALPIGQARLRAGVSILHGEDMTLATRIRRHANFTESVPLALILLAALELNGAGAGLVHGLGATLVVARIAHPLGLHHDNLRHPLRAVGAGLTTLVTLVAAIVAIWRFLAGS